MEYNGTRTNIDPMVANGLGAAGFVAALILGLVPFRDVYFSEKSIYRLGTSEHLVTGLNYHAGFFNNIFWVFYTCTRLPDLLASFSINIVGLVLNFFLMSCYWYFSTGNQRRTANIQIGMLLVFTFITVIIWIYLEDNEFIGILAAVLNTLMYFGPLAGASEVIRTRNVSGMPFPPLLMTFICSSLWASYGLYIFNIPIIVPNALGVFFGLLEMAVYFYAYCRGPTQSGTKVEDVDDGSSGSDASI